MIIDDKTYKLDVNKYVPLESEKKQIVLGNTFNDGMRHVFGWETRYNGKYKKTASFTIDKKGKIYQHFDPKYYSRYFNNPDQNTKSVVILIENIGWLTKDNKKTEYTNCFNEKYYGEIDGIMEKKWRDYVYWAPYNDEQLESAIKLVRTLCSDLNIPKLVVAHNTKIDDLYDFEGVLYKSNIEKHFTDLNPNWKFEIFKNKIEL